MALLKSVVGSITEEHWTSVGIIALTLAVGEASRKLLLPPNLPTANYGAAVPFGTVLLAEIIMAMERTVTLNELSIFLMTDHVILFYCFFATLMTWFNFRWIATKSTLIRHVHLLHTGATTIWKVLVHLSMELVFGFLAFPLIIRPLWMLLNAQKIRNSMLEAECKSSLAVSVTTGFTVEFMGTFLIRILDMTLPYIISNTFVQSITLTSFGGALVVYALGITGGFYNPVMAAVFEFGCKGATILDHIQVYWLSTILATVAAHFGFRYLESAVGGVGLHED